MKKILFLSTLFLLAASATMAQKYGHLNFGNLVASMPETKAADSELEAYQKQLVAQGEEMAKGFQSKYETFVQGVQGGDFTPVQQREKEAELQKLRQDILAYEQQVGQQVEAKRRELLAPVLKKAQDAVSAIGKENNYQFIFDTSVFNSILFAEDADDVMDLVKAKLGLQ